MDLLLQNHPKERVFPVKIRWKYFQQSKDTHRWLYLVAVFSWVVAVMTGVGLFMMLQEQHQRAAVATQYVIATKPADPVPAVLALIGSTMLFIVIIRRICSTPKREQQIYYKNSGATLLPEEKRQALRLHLVDMFNAGFWSETLEYYPLAARKGTHRYTYLTPAAAVQYCTLLDKDWNILGADDYRAISTRLLTDGYHARSFALTLTLKDEQHTISKRLAGLTGLSEAYILSCLQRGADGRPAKLIWAFEFWRAIVVARNAFMAGYITEAEAWKDILRAADLSYEVFESFGDFSDNFRLGNAFWSDSLAVTKERADQYALFSKQCNWPMAKLPWPAPKGVILPQPVSGAYAVAIAEARSTIGQQGSLN